MITPSFGLTATERVLPRLALDFTTAILDPRVTFTRSGNTATVTNSSGVIVGVNADIPRFDYNPTTLLCNGLLIEESRTNVLLSSLLDGTSLATQTVVVTAAARTLSFYGTGQIVLSGAASATVTGTGAYPTRTTLTFTPSAGALILTVTGTVQFAQLELGSFATSFIPTTASQVTRTADVATMTGTNFSDWFNASEGSFAVNATLEGVSSFTTFFANLNSNSTTNFIALGHGGTGSAPYFRVSDTNVDQCLIAIGAAISTTQNQLVGSYKANNFDAGRNGASGTPDTSGTVPSGIDRMIFFNRNGADRPMSGWIKNFNYWPQQFTSAECAAFSKQ